MIYLQILLEPFRNQKEILDLMEFYISKAEANKEEVKMMKAGQKKKIMKHFWFKILIPWKGKLSQTFPQKNNNNWNKIK